MRPTLRPLVLVFWLTACSVPRSERPPLLALWEHIGESAHAVDADWAAAQSAAEVPCETFRVMTTNSPMRLLTCAADRIVPTGLHAQRFGGPVFVSGPHALGAERLDLSSDDFGRYNPAFVQWAVDAALVAEGKPALRASTAAAYRLHVRPLARAYWLAHADLARDGFPEVLADIETQDYVLYLRGGPVPSYARNGGDEEGKPWPPGFSTRVFGYRNEPLAERLSEGDRYAYWRALYDLNAGTTFWLRRREDGTHGAFRDGLRQLLALYDAEWLGSAAVF